MTVDTLSLAKELRAAELSPMQAEAIAAAIGRAVLEGTATKADLLQLGSEGKAEAAVLRSDMKSEAALLRSDLREAVAHLETKIEQVRTTLMTWFIGTILTVTAVIIAVVKL